MDKIYTRLVGLGMILLLFVPLHAQTLLGYSNGTAARKNGHRFGSSTTQGMAIRIPKEKAELLKGSQITGIKTAFGTSQIKNLKFFVTKDLQSKVLYEQAGSGATTSWKEFQFDTPYAVDGEEFYVGYTFEVAVTYKPLLFDESHDMANGYSWIYQDGSWVDVSCNGLGVANIRLMMEDVPSFTDVIIKPIKASGYFKQGQQYCFTGQIYNFGTETIRSFELKCSVGDEEPIVYKVGDVQLTTGNTYDFELPDFVATATGKLPFRVSVSNINGTVEADASDNASEVDVFFYPQEMEKKILIETFTGQTCGNCPTGHATLEKGIKDFEDDFVIVSHHAGYNPDIFTTEEDVQYTWLYNSSSLYAPACTFNRMPYEDGLSSVVFNPTDSKSLNAAIQKGRTLPPYVSIELGNQFDEQSREGVLSVRLHTYENPQGLHHRLNVFLVQDNIVAYQSGAGSNYNHVHVFRDALSGVWGDAIELNEGQTIQREYSYHIPTSIESTYYSTSGQGSQFVDAILKDLKFVVFVSNVSDNPLDCHVYNVAALDVTQYASLGVHEAVSTTNPWEIRCEGNHLYLQGDFQTYSVYNTSGRCVERSNGKQKVIILPSGLYVVRMIASNGRCISKKVLVP